MLLFVSVNLLISLFSHSDITETPGSQIQLHQNLSYENVWLCLNTEDLFPVKIYTMILIESFWLNACERHMHICPHLIQHIVYLPIQEHVSYTQC